MKRQLWVPLIGVLIGCLALLCGRGAEEENGFTLPGYQNADAKFLGSYVITSVEEGIRLLDFEGSVVQQYDGLKASWLYVQEIPGAKEAEYAVAYSNHDKETHILTLTEEGTYLQDQTVLRSDTLAIDPILLSIREGEEWLLAHTWIEGVVNNPDPQGENGTYTVKLYHSTDLTNWEYVTDIISREQNLEDGDFRYVDGVLYYFFEMEQYDKGPSAICAMRSMDEGRTWEEPIELLPAVADNEMASCEPTEEGWRLYVSSDYTCVGESYQGASVYYADYTEDLTPVCTYQPSAMPDNEAVRLYEVKEIDGMLHFLYARNFLTDCDLLLRVLAQEDESES